MRINSISVYNLRSNLYGRAKAPASFPAAKTQTVMQNPSFGHITGAVAENGILCLKNPRYPDNKRETFGERHLDEFEILKNTPVLEFSFDDEKNKHIRYGDPFIYDVMCRPVFMWGNTEKQLEYQDKVLKKLYKKFGIKPGKNEFLAKYNELLKLSDFVEKKLPMCHFSGVIDHLFALRDENYITVLAKEKKGGLFNPDKMVWRKKWILKPYFPKVIEYEDGRIDIDRTHAYDLPEGYKFIAEGRQPLK